MVVFQKRRLILALSLVCVLLFSPNLVSCKKKKAVDPVSSADVFEETLQQLGDLMAAVDETSGKLTGVYSFNRLPGRNMRLAGGAATVARRISDWVLPIAMAGSCSSVATFSACNDGLMERDFGGCSIGNAVFSGSVTLQFSDPGCSLLGAGASVIREPEYSVEGLRSSSLSVSKTAVFGQRLSHVSGTQFAFRSDGIRRVFAIEEVPVLDFTSETTSDLVITGTNRGGRTLNGGTVRITNNLSGVICSATPSGLTWDVSCNCPLSGTWTGSCSDGSALGMTITGCGVASASFGGSSSTLRLDRCGS